MAGPNGQPTAAPAATGQTGGSNTDLSSLGPKLARGERPVELSFALGWHVAELYGLPVETIGRQGPAQPPLANQGGQPPTIPPAEAGTTGQPATAVIPAEATAAPQITYLKPPRELAADQLNKLLKTQIEVDLAALIVSLGDDVPGDARNAVEAARALEVPLTSDADFYSKVQQLDEEYLEALTAAGFRLEKAYSVGRAVYPVTAQNTLDDLRDVGVGGGLFTALTGWLRDLKSSFATCAADTVIVTLLQWEALATNPATGVGKPGADGQTATAAPDFKSVLQRQGEIWRSLLSGEKAATDYLNLGDYVSAGQHLIQHYAQLARTVVSRWWVWLAAVVILSLAITALAIVFNQGTAVIGVGAALLGLLGVTSATVTAAVRQALQLLQRPLWEAEITDAMIVSTSMAPIKDDVRTGIIDTNWRAQKYEGAGRSPTGRGKAGGKG